LIVTRKVILFAVCGVFAWAQEAAKPSPVQQTPPQQAAPSPQPPAEDNPPEEDEGEKPQVYSFNPIEAEHDIKIGAFYMHKGSYRAAAKRFEEATKWNPGMAEAYFHLGEAREKLKEKDAARTAYAKVVQLAPDSKEGHDAKKKLAGKL
jgi:tetratricopeptide (TPR) repeat protein